MRHLLEALLQAEPAVPYLVLRNAEDLPERLSGTDLDLCVATDSHLEDADRELCQRARGVGWQPISASAFPHVVGLAFVRSAEREAARIRYSK